MATEEQYSVITNSYRVSIAETLYDDIYANRTKLFTFIGRTLPYNETDELEPILINEDYEKFVRQNIVAAKRIIPNSVSFLINRIIWTSGITYDRYDTAYTSEYTSFNDRSSLKESAFYVLNSEFNVYKCLYNANDLPSVVEPTGQQSARFTTADGYVWKYMYNIPQGLRDRFLNAFKIPVTTDRISKILVTGAISDVIISNPGSGYSYVDIVVNGDGEDLDLEAVIIGGQVVDVIINNSGSNYSFVELSLVNYSDVGKTILEDPDTVATLDVVLQNANTFQADVENNAVNGEISSIRILNIGSGYPLTTTEKIVGDGIGGKIELVINTSGEIVEAKLVFDPESNGYGRSYRYATVELENFGGGTGFSARVILSPFGGHGFNAIQELYASTLAIFNNIKNNILTPFNINNQYRTFGIIENPLRSSNLLLSEEQNLNYCYDIRGNYNDVDFQVNDILQSQDETKNYVIVSKLTNRLLLQAIDNDQLLPGEILTKVGTNNSITVDTIIRPTTNRFSGNLMYYENSTPFTSNIQQNINVITTIQF